MCMCGLGWAQLSAQCASSVTLTRGRSRAGPGYAGHMLVPWRRQAATYFEPFCKGRRAFGFASHSFNPCDYSSLIFGAISSITLCFQLLKYTEYEYE